MRRRRALHQALAERLLPLARLPADFRFLVNHAPDLRFAQDVIGRAPVPNRLDIPHVAANPARLVRRYLDFLEAELALTAATR
jgi:hypothetical protein